MEGAGEEYVEASNGDQQYTQDQSAYEQPGYEQQQDSGEGDTAISNPGDRINASKNDDDERKIFVGGLSWETTVKDLRDYFSTFGPVADCTIKQDPETGRSRGFGFVLFSSSDALEKVIAQSHHSLHGKTIDPKKAKARGGREPIKKVFVGGLDPDVPENDIRDHFSKFGKIEEIDLPFDKIKGQRRAFCFITFDSEAVVDGVVAEPKQYLAGKEVDVKKATPKNDRGFDGGFGGGFGGRGRGRGSWGNDQRGGRGGRGGGRGGYNQGGWGGNQNYGGYGGGSNDYYNQGYGGGYDYYNQGYGGGYDYSQYYNQGWGNYNQGGYGQNQGYGQGGYGQGYGGGGYDYSGWYGNGNQVGGQQQQQPQQSQQGAASTAVAGGGYKAKGGGGRGASTGASSSYHPYSR